MLEQLPPGFAVFHDVPLPSPSRATVDHVVVGPCGVWAIEVVSTTDDIVFGSGRGADTLWAGRTPLRIPIEECESNAATLASALGRPVQPLLCVDGNLPSESFDFHGLSVCSPEALTTQLAVSVAEFESVALVVRRMTERLDVEPSNRFELPTLATGGVTSMAAVAPRPGRRRGPRPRVPRRARRSGVGRSRILVVGGAAVLVAVLQPGWFGLDSTPGGVDEPVLDDTASEPLPVGYAVTCGPDGRPQVAWTWPGDLPGGVAAYGVRSRRADGVTVDHTVDGWSRRSDAPPPVEIRDEVTSVITEHRDGDGRVLSSVERPFVRPASLDC